jgi:hypothetical protein
LPPVERWAFAACTARRCSREARRTGSGMVGVWRRDAEEFERMVRSFADALIATWKTP